MFPFDLFSRSGRATPTRRARLSLETLNPRLAPSGSGGDDWDYISVPDAPPRIVDFAAVQVSGGLYTFSGRVLDESPAGLTVTFGGSPLTMNGVTITTESNGFFSVTKTLQRDGSDTGAVTALTRDVGGQQSNVPSVEVDPT
jgi:hypothetical protein